MIHVDIDFHLAAIFKRYYKQSAMEQVLVSHHYENPITILWYYWIAWLCSLQFFLQKFFLQN